MSRCKKGFVWYCYRCAKGIEEQTQVVNLKKDKYDVYIGRPSFWGNPFSIGKDGNRDEVIEKYENYIRNRPGMLSRPLNRRGKR